MVFTIFKLVIDPDIYLAKDKKVKFNFTAVGEYPNCAKSSDGYTMYQKHKVRNVLKSFMHVAHYGIIKLVFYARQVIYST